MKYQYQVTESKGLVSNKEKKNCHRIWICPLIVLLCVVILAILLVCLNPTDIFDFNGELSNSSKNNDDMNKTVQFLMNPIQLCTSSDHVKILILVDSLSGNNDLREAIRDTWGSLGRSQQALVRIAFVIGKNFKNETLENQIRMENWLKRDIIQLDIEDSIKNQAAKSSAMLHWAADFCSNAEYVFKTEDSTFIDVEFLLQTIVNEEKYRNGTIFIGSYSIDQNASDDQTSKDLEDAFGNLNVETLPYNGATYMMGHDALKLLSDFLNYDMEFSIIDKQFLKTMGIPFMEDNRLRKHPAPQEWSGFKGYISACGYEAPKIRLLWQELLDSTPLNITFESTNSEKIFDDFDEQID